MKLFVINASLERKKNIEEHFDKRGVTEYFDVEFVRDFTIDDPFVKWIYKCVAPHIDIREMSGFVKMCEIFKKIVEGENEHAVVCNDDVVFVKEWKKYFDENNWGFMDIICIGVSFQLKPGGEYAITHNAGGGESIVVSQKFAKFFLDNIEFGHGCDLVFGAMLMYHKIPIGATPICHQTSILECKFTHGGYNNTKFNHDWVTFTNNYKPSGLKYEFLKQEFEKFMKMKKTAEENFKLVYDTDIDLWNVEYIVHTCKNLQI